MVLIKNQALLADIPLQALWIPRLIINPLEFMGSSQIMVHNHCMHHAPFLCIRVADMDPGSIIFSPSCPDA